MCFLDSPGRDLSKKGRGFRFGTIPGPTFLEPPHDPRLTKIPIWIVVGSGLCVAELRKEFRHRVIRTLRVNMHDLLENFRYRNGSLAGRMWCRISYPSKNLRELYLVIPRSTNRQLGERKTVNIKHNFGILEFRTYGTPKSKRSIQQSCVECV